MSSGLRSSNAGAPRCGSACRRVQRAGHGAAARLSAAVVTAAVLKRSPLASRTLGTCGGMQPQRAAGEGRIRMCSMPKHRKHAPSRICRRWSRTSAHGPARGTQGSEPRGQTSPKAVPMSERPPRLATTCPRVCAPSCSSHTSAPGARASTLKDCNCNVILGDEALRIERATHVHFDCR